MDERLVGLSQQVAGYNADPFTTFDPPVPEAELAAAEAELGITFPEPFRTFLREVSAGHSHGTFRFALNDARAAGNTATPFPLRHADHPAAIALGEVVDAADDAPGTFLVWNHGCGEESRLVVAGPERGHVWRRVETGWCAEGDPDAEAPVPLDYAGWLAWWFEVW
ncbi:MAG: hypothetical protein KC635_09630 [Myxococcales bacterium]|nr:hypothetical protein [Myxococcales bacterium]MCB9734551.1 hypothetical protein [Deltaproteobacteria bacterium]